MEHAAHTPALTRLPSRSVFAVAVLAAVVALAAHVHLTVGGWSASDTAIHLGWIGLHLMMIGLAAVLFGRRHALRRAATDYLVILVLATALATFWWLIAREASSPRAMAVTMTAITATPLLTLFDSLGRRAAALAAVLILSINLALPPVVAAADCKGAPAFDLPPLAPTAFAPRSLGCVDPAGWAAALRARGTAAMAEITWFWTVEAPEALVLLGDLTQRWPGGE